MRKGTKRLTGLMMAGMMLLLSACGGGGGESATSAAGGEGGGASAEPITLTMMVSGTKAPDGQDFVIDILPKLVKEKFPNVTLETSKLPDEQYMTSIRTKLASGQGPDFFWVFPRNASLGVLDMAKAGYAADLSDLEFWDKISEGAKEDMSYEGKPYGVAGGLDYLGVYYNKALFEQAGITELPKDWPAFLEASQKLKDAGITPITLADKDPWFIQFGMYQVAANMVYPDEMDFDTKLQAGEKSLSDPKWIATIERFKELYDNGYVVKNSLGLGSAQAAQMFVDGQAAMIFDGTWDYATLTGKGASEFERGFFALPANDPGKPTYISAATAAGFALNAKSENLDTAKEVMNYMFDGESELFKAWVDSNNSISVYEGVPLNNELFKEVNDSYLKDKNSVYFPNQMWPTGVAEEMEAKFAGIIGGQGITPEQVAEAMDKKFKELWKP
ncbi:ABC transporter substrate-binding protein [Saccharibacillus kuerlensis]|uniref:Sugar ABC transporter substrate-binding protein n=1 Tax=Saccharibacillus kuerlensis TaxID=459527 RepID=A0ABQ2L3U5_9BACL|nr:extracellular solute-binding protein [Saccharibacillus kuerlensis]GGO01754.1 sugar ABC transporter substrate-binding protein [Saccharibacillus kuerlensis]